ncbi:CPBP family intramembrane glutamic endopeptidase [Fictibacillus phosphorivorans]|uniref:CPBP family intramembrane glutamic endopeptidase n=1 Tax=Fictibacillus phosphorivorans TaxID=1221500 RepID=UPI0009ECEF5A
MLLNAIIFSLVHLPSLDILPVNIVNGILFALAYEKTRSIYVPMIIHGLFNAILFLGVLIGN